MVHILVGAFALIATGLRVDVVGDCACPLVADVQSQLATLLVAPSTGVGRDDSPDQSRHVAHLARSHDGMLHIELRRPDGEPVAKRALTGVGTCGDLAAAVAVVIATWEAEIDPRVAMSVALPATAPGALPPTPAVPAPPIMVTAATAPPSLPSPARFAVRMGLLASIAGPEIVPGAILEGSLAPRGRRLGLGATLSLTTPRTASVGSMLGIARWTRVALQVGPELRLHGGATMIDVHAAAVATILWVEGMGLPVNASDTSGQLGAATGLRGGWAWGTAAVWIGLDLLIFPGQDRLEIGGVSDVGHLSRLELLIASGLSLGQFL